MDNKELEELVMKEGIVSATGINADQLQIGIKGDPSLRETAFSRERYESPVDSIFEKLEPVLEDLLLNRGPYKIYLGFNNCEVRTISVFDPLREEIHEADKLIEPEYVERHFPRISYEEKVEGIRSIYRKLRRSTMYSLMPEFWKNITKRRHKSWEPMEKEEILNILKTLSVLRTLPEFYLRNVTISIVQSVVRMQFNCDGTQIVRAEDFQEFLESNLP